MNKALEQKLIGPLEESHTEEQSPKAVSWMELWARRSKMAARWARTRVWAVWWFFWEEGVCGCWNKWRGPLGAHEAGGVPWTLVARCWLPLMCSQCQIFSNILEKTYFIFGAFGELLFWGIFLLHGQFKKQTKILFFSLFNLNNRK